MRDKQPFQTQDNNGDAWVGVREGFHERTQEQITEFLIQGKNPKDHIHLGINNQGKEVFRQRR